MKSYKNKIKTILQKGTRFLPKRNNSHYIYKDSNDPYSAQKIQKGSAVVLSVGKTIFNIWWAGVKKSLSLIIHKKTLKIIGVLFVLGMVAIALVFLYFWTQLDSIGDLQERRIVSAKVYDRTGTVVLYNIFGSQQREVVDLDTIPYHTQIAVIVAEDDNFYNHFGIDIEGVLRSAWRNVVQRKVAQGGSTITQQFIKNALLTPEQGTAQRTLGRKIKEVILSIELEIKYSKDEILELYLNEIPYGSSVYGIATASQKYFGKSVEDLTLGESALLAALPKAPSYYLNNPDILEQRRQYILSRMKNLGYINEKQEQEAIEENVVISQIINDIQAPHFVLEVKQQLEERYGSALVERGGLKVITTLDAQIQTIAEQAVQEYAERNQSRYSATNAALVAIDHKTGEVLAMVGSRDYFNEEIDGNVNVAMRPRQPGSSFKPFAYAQALREGYTIDTIVYDVPTEFREYCIWEANQTRGSDGRSCYHPQNYDDEFVGAQTLKEALAQSRNVPAVKVLYLAGIEDTVQLAQDMGISTLENVKDDQLSLVLGSGEVTLLEETSAYGAFATRGTHTKPIFIRNVTNTSGTINDSFIPETKKVLEGDITDQITHALSTNAYRIPTFGPNSVLNTPGITSAVKTGTNQNYKDAWTIGYTPSISVGVWVGNNNGDLMRPGAGGSTVAGPIWNKFMRDVYREKQDVEDKEQLENDFILPNPRTESFPQNRTPKTSKNILNGEVDEIFPHSILYFVDKNNPTGGQPNNPQSNDRLYQNFERPVRSWAGVEYERDEFINTAGIITFTSLTDNQTIYDPQLTFGLVVSAPKKLKSVNIYLDDELMSAHEIEGQSLALSDIFVPNIEQGFHNIIVRVVAEDSSSYVATRSIFYTQEKPSTPTADGENEEQEKSNEQRIELRDGVVIIKRPSTPTQESEDEIKEEEEEEIESEEDEEEEIETPTIRIRTQETGGSGRIIIDRGN